MVLGKFKIYSWKYFSMWVMYINHHTEFTGSIKCILLVLFVMIKRVITLKYYLSLLIIWVCRSIKNGIASYSIARLVDK
jgi:hypothetical protein